MARTFNVNLLPANGSGSIFELKAQLKVAGWTVPRSSDGLTYNAAADQITAATTGAGGMDNSHAWFVIQAPAGGRQLCFRRSTSSNFWWIRYSFSAGFTGGSPAATVAPTATDEQNVFGTSTAGSSILSSTANSRQHIWAENAAPYGFGMISWVTGTVVPNFVLAMDPLVSGSYPVEDVDPFVFWSHGAGGNPVYTTANSNGSNVKTVSLANGAGGCWCFLKKGLAGEGWTIVPMMQFQHLGSGDAAIIFSDRAGGTNPHNSKDDVLPVFYGRHSSLTSPYGFKGLSTYFKWLTSVRANADLITITTTGDNLVFGGALVVPWNNTVPSL